MDLQLQNQCKYEVNTTFDHICLYLPRGKFYRWIIFAREADGKYRIYSIFTVQSK